MAFNMRPIVPLSIIRDLKCRHCQRFVTCGPVHVVPDGGILCGRCQAFAKPDFRNNAYEAIASLYSHPCNFWTKHCSVPLQWNESYNHEINCIYDSSCRLFFIKPGSFFSSQRRLPDGGDVHFEHVTDQVLDSIRCLICESYLSCDPVYIAPDGKSICHRCVTSNGVPKTCVRNLAYEKLAATLIFPCIYRQRGCVIRLTYGREMWKHEADCPYGQTHQKITKKPLKVGGKERGVIQTHSGHIYGTITPHSALFSPPKVASQTANGGQIVTQELERVMKKKQDDDNNNRFNDYQSQQSFDSQSIDSIVNHSRASSIELDNPRRNTRDTASIDNISRSSSRPPTREDNYSHSSKDLDYQNQNLRNDHYRKLSEDSILSIPRPSVIRTDSQQSHLGVVPLPTPAGYNRTPQYNGYYQPNLTDQQYHSYMSHFPPLMVPYNNNSQAENQDNAQVKKNESFRVGNQGIIDEIRKRQQLREVQRQNSERKEKNPFEKTNNLQDLQQMYDDVFED